MVGLNDKLIRREGRRPQILITMGKPTKEAQPMAGHSQRRSNPEGVE
jgi:hypothetical protein